MKALIKSYSNYNTSFLRGKHAIWLDFPYIDQREKYKLMVHITITTSTFPLSGKKVDGKKVKKEKEKRKRKRRKNGMIFTLNSS